ncbi:MAG TPA: hypothetical protein VMT38_11925 [Terracidiphilus sp.]|nr:hypothetical protein [Terracidiphilus sp.]
MRLFWQAIWFVSPIVALSQTAPPIGDIYQSGTPQPVQQAFQKVYNLAAEITADPSFDFQQAKADSTNWPDIAKAQAQWDAAMAQDRTELSQQERNEIVPCVAHLNAAIDAMERGYLISQTQQSSPLSARTVVTLYGKGRVEFAKCLSTGIATDGTPETGGGAPEMPGSGPTTNAPGTGGGTPGNNPGGGSTDSGEAPGSGPSNSAPGGGALPALQAASDFSDKLRADAETILQSAGRISKAMTDAMDVTKHNNVGVGVGFGSAFGAVARMMGVVAQQYRTLAAAGGAVAQESQVLQIAADAASESGSMANQAEQLESRLGSTAGTSEVSTSGLPNFMEDAVFESDLPALPAQSELPTCAVLSCARLSQMLGRNTQLMEILEKIKPKIVLETAPDGETYASGGLTPQETAAALKNIDITAEVDEGLKSMVDTVTAGKPVIAPVYTTGATNGPVHAVVIEGIETRADVQGLRIYDPMGFVFWQPVSTFAKYFTNTFIKPI